MMNRLAALLLLAFAFLAPAAAHADSIDCSTPGSRVEDGLCHLGYAKGSSASVTRPGNTATYTANTAWANATSGATYLTFTGVCRANGTAVLPTDLFVTLDDNETLKLTGELWLFDTAPTAINDNATFSVASGDMANVKTVIPFSTSTVANQGSTSSGWTLDEETNLGRQLKCAASDTNLYGLVKVTNAYVPASGRTLKLLLRVVGVN